jgi:hypothetical protein
MSQIRSVLEIAFFCAEPMAQVARKTFGTGLLDGNKYIAQQDSHISEPGAVGVWTKSDSVTAFDLSFDGK